MPCQRRRAIAWHEVPTREEGNRILDKIHLGYKGDGKIGLRSDVNSSLIKRRDALGGVLQGILPGSLHLDAASSGGAR